MILLSLNPRTTGKRFHLTNYRFGTLYPILGKISYLNAQRV